MRTPNPHRRRNSSLIIEYDLNPRQGTKPRVSLKKEHPAPRKLKLLGKCRVIQAPKE